MENQKLLDFTAIDFETMTGERTSACALGIVRVENGVIMQKFYSLIRPIPDDRTKNNTYVHGITPEMTASAPTFAELWPRIKRYFVDQVVVCHNEDFDMDVLDKVSSYYGIHCDVLQCVDTMNITHLGLTDSCAMTGIDLGNHHDALCDATACAKIMLLCQGIRVEEPNFEKMSASGRRKRDLSSEAKKPLEAEEVENKDTPFYQKKIVLTGILDSYPIREELARMLRGYGADINSSVSKKTDIVIVGHGCGPSKMKKIGDLQAEGFPIRVIYEQEFLEIVEKYNIS